jgi:hypothetical protein
LPLWIAALLFIVAIIIGFIAIWRSKEEGSAALAYVGIAISVLFILLWIALFGFVGILTYEILDNSQQCNIDYPFSCFASYSEMFTDNPILIISLKSEKSDEIFIHGISVDECESTEISNSGRMENGLFSSTFRCSNNNEQRSFTVDYAQGPLQQSRTGYIGTGLSRNQPSPQEAV